MKAQAYFGAPLMIVRVFDSGNDWDESIADLRLDDPTPKEADKALHRLGLYRAEKWQTREWGLEARLKAV